MKQCGSRLSSQSSCPGGPRLQQLGPPEKPTSSEGHDEQNIFGTALASTTATISGGRGDETYLISERRLTIRAFAVSSDTPYCNATVVLELNQGNLNHPGR